MKLLLSSLFNVCMLGKLPVQAWTCPPSPKLLRQERMGSLSASPANDKEDLTLGYDPEYDNLNWMMEYDDLTEEQYQKLRAVDEAYIDMEDGDDENENDMGCDGQ